MPVPEKPSRLSLSQRLQPEREVLSDPDYQRYVQTLQQLVPESELKGMISPGQYIKYRTLIATCNHFLPPETGLPVFRTVTELLVLTDYPKLHRLLETLSLRTLASALRTQLVLKPYSITTTQDIVEHWNPVFDYWLTFPDWARFLAQSEEVVRTYSALPAAPLSWGERLKVMQTGLAALGLHGVTDEQVSEVVLQLWRARQAVDQRSIYLPGVTITADKIHTSGDFDRASAGQQQIFISRLRNGLRPGQALQIKKAIRERLGISSELELSERRLQLIEAREDENYPLRPHCVSWGYEIEHSIPDGIPGIIYPLLDAHGIKKGYDAANEFSPGPFYHPQTGIYVWNLFCHGGLIDVHQNYKRTCHLNFGVLDFSLSAENMRLIQARMELYHPEFGQGDGKQTHHTLKINHKNAGQGAGSYTEMKEGRMMTSRGTERSLKVAVALAQGQKAQEHLTRSPYATPLQVKMAKARQQAIDDVRIGLGQKGWPDILSLNAPMTQARGFYRHLLSVVPDLAAHYDPDVSKKVVGAKITVGEQAYLNLVALVREKTDQAAQTITRDFNTLERQVIEALRAMSQYPTRQLLTSHALLEYGKYVIPLAINSHSSVQTQEQTKEKIRTDYWLTLNRHLSWFRKYGHLFAQDELDS